MTGNLKELTPSSPPRVPGIGFGGIDGSRHPTDRRRQQAEGRGSKTQNSPLQNSQLALAVGIGIEPNLMIQFRDRQPPKGPTDSRNARQVRLLEVSDDLLQNLLWELVGICIRSHVCV